MILLHVRPPLLSVGRHRVRLSRARWPVRALPPPGRRRECRSGHDGSSEFKLRGFQRREVQSARRVGPFPATRADREPVSRRARPRSSTSATARMSAPSDPAAAYYAGAPFYVPPPASASASAAEPRNKPRHWPNVSIGRLRLLFLRALVLLVPLPLLLHGRLVGGVLFAAASPSVCIVRRLLRLRLLLLLLLSPPPLTSTSHL